LIEYEHINFEFQELLRIANVTNITCLIHVVTSEMIDCFHKVRHPRCVYNKLDWSVYTCLTQLYIVVLDKYTHSTLVD